MSYSATKLIFIVVAVVLAGGIYFLFVSPQWQDAKVLQAELSSRREELKKTEEFSSTYLGLRAKYARMIEEGRGEEINSIIPHAREIPEMLVQLEAIAAQTGNGGAVMRSIDFGAGPSSGGMPDILNITLQMNARYEAFKEYLERLSRNRRLFDVTTITFSSSAGGGLEEGGTAEEPAYDFSLGLKTYFQR